MHRRISTSVTSPFAVRLTDLEKAHVKRLAAAAGMTASDYMRGLVPGLADVPHAAPVVTTTIQPEEAVATT